MDSNNYMLKIKKLGKELGNDWLNAVLEKISYKDPVLWPQVVSQMVWNKIQPSSEDPKSVKVYAILTEQSEEDMRNYMIKDGK